MHFSCIVLAKNEEDVIEKCLKSFQPLASYEIILINDGSTDNTLNIAEKYHAKIFDFKIDDFSQARNFAADKTKGIWLVYVDADEQMSPQLALELNYLIDQNSEWSAFEVGRENYYLGKRWPVKEKMVRVIKKNALVSWSGKVHESVKVKGKIGQLENSLIHDTHRNLSEMIANTLKWSKIEADLRYEKNHPSVVWWRFPRVMLPAFLDSYIKQGGWKLGTIGMIESLYQAFSIFVTYARLWELQQKRK
jgi:glycosyltransferase involved in cell wall biosynthesis